MEICNITSFSFSLKKKSKSLLSTHISVVQYTYQQMLYLQPKLEIVNIDIQSKIHSHGNLHWVSLHCCNPASAIQSNSASSYVALHVRPAEVAFCRVASNAHSSDILCVQCPMPIAHSSDIFCNFGTEPI